MYIDDAWPEAIQLVSRGLQPVDMSAVYDSVPKVLNLSSVCVESEEK